MEGEHFFTKDIFTVTDVMKQDFSQHGYILIRNILDKEELDKLEVALNKDDGIRKHGFSVADGEGRNSKLCLWNHPGTDISGMVGRSEKVAGTAESLLGGEVYHYHTKLMMKEAFTGGKHVWHQDYGYWYKNGCLFPDMLTVFIAIDRCDRSNGCLQILDGSHKCGRIEHIMVGGQTGADTERVDQLKKVLKLRHVEMNPGDALFFHANLLHKSDVNDSPSRRWAFLCAYNLATNDPVYEHHHPFYAPLHKVPNSAIRECTNFTDFTGKDFMDPSQDKTIKCDKAEVNEK
ncbi:L-proline trans-4-hydroxylase-like isoform X2 [Tubulanus polymorphus]|uniref:L-proline trans-4-hydroxylase-like isoform X2 n=1 Tax=Tubulanus polymorphus TaxID=672921 RepID=UPI003DA28919